MKKQTVYTEVPVSEGLPEVNQDGNSELLFCYDEEGSENVCYYFSTTKRWHNRFGGIEVVKSWLKKKENIIIFTESELKKIAGDAFEAGEKRQYHDLKKAYNENYNWEAAEPHTPTKEQYLSNLLK